MLKSKHSSDLKALKEAHETEVSGLRSKLESQSSILSVN